jgi:hypothetical protein
VKGKLAGGASRMADIRELLAVQICKMALAAAGSASQMR